MPHSICCPNLDAQKNYIGFKKAGTIWFKTLICHKGSVFDFVAMAAFYMIAIKAIRLYYFRPLPIFKARTSIRLRVG